MGGLGFVARILASRSFLTKTGRGGGGVHLLYPVLCVAQGWRRVRRGWHGFNG